MRRQQMRREEREEKRIREMCEALRRTNPLAETLHQLARQEGWEDGVKWAYKVSFAAAIITLHRIEGYGAKRNVRFLREMYEEITQTLSSAEIIEEALKVGGVKLNFGATFGDEAVEESDEKIDTHGGKPLW